MSAPTRPHPIDRERFELLAPAFVAGTLKGSDLEWFVQALGEDTAAQHSLDWHQAFADRLHQHHDQRSPRAGLDAALSRIALWPRAQAAHAGASATALRRAAHVEPNPGPIQKLIGWLFAGGPRFSPAYAALAVMAIVPALMLWNQVDAPTNPPWSEVRSSKAGMFDGPLLRVNFKASAQETDIRHLLSEQGALAIGPTRLGDWYLKVKPERNDSVLSALKASAFVTSADMVPGLPEELLQ